MRIQNLISNSFAKNIFAFATITTVIVIVYHSALSSGFLDWDDMTYVIDYPHLGDIGHFWTSFSDGYIPVTYTWWSLALNFFGKNATAFHFLNILFHILTTLVVYLLLKSLLEYFYCSQKNTKKKYELFALMGALLFAVHPLQVEAVCWVTSLKDISSGFFSCLALFCFVRFRKKKHKNIYVFGLVMFLLAMLSKPTAVSVLPIILIIDLLLFRKSVRSTIMFLIPWVLIALPILTLNALSQEKLVSLYQAPWFSRPFIALDAMGFYLYKLFLPLTLLPDYGRSPRNLIANGLIYWTWIPVTGLIMASLIAVWRNNITSPSILPAYAGLRLQRGNKIQKSKTKSPCPTPDVKPGCSTLKKGESLHQSNIPLFQHLGRWGQRPSTNPKNSPPYQGGVPNGRGGFPSLHFPIAGFFLFLAGLLTVSGLIPFAAQNNSTVYDRYVYLSMIGAALAFCFVLAGIRKYRTTAVLTGCILIAVLSYKSMAQCKIWENDFRLWNYTLKQKQDSVVALVNLGRQFSVKGNTVRALQLYQKAVEIAPFDPDAQNNLGSMMAKTGNMNEAEFHFKEAIRLNPLLRTAHENLMRIYMLKRDWNNSQQSINILLKLNSRHIDANLNHAEIYLHKQQFEKCIIHLNDIKQWLKNNPDVENFLGVAYAGIGDNITARTHFKNALELNPQHKSAKQNFSRSFQEK